ELTEHRGPVDKPSERPERVPVVVVERAEVLGRDASRHQPDDLLVAAAGLELPADPANRARHRVGVAEELTREPPVLGHRPERGAVGVPLLPLAEEEAVDAESITVGTDHLRALAVEPVS